MDMKLPEWKEFNKYLNKNKGPALNITKNNKNKISKIKTITNKKSAAGSVELSQRDSEF